MSESLSVVRMLTIKEAAELMGVSQTLLRRKLADEDTIAWGNERRLPYWYLLELQKKWLGSIGKRVDEMLMSQDSKVAYVKSTG